LCREVASRSLGGESSERLLFPGDELDVLEERSSESSRKNVATADQEQEALSGARGFEPGNAAMRSEPAPPFSDTTPAK
jgi:hypothetical protein